MLTSQLRHWDGCARAWLDTRAIPSSSAQVRAHIASNCWTHSGAEVDGCQVLRCGANAVCTDLAPPSVDAECGCLSGFTGDPLLGCTGSLSEVIGHSCVILTDIDACVSQPCHAQATCTDLAAPSLDRSCACNTGYQGDGAAVCFGMMRISHACCVSHAQISTRVSASRAVPTACAVIFQRRRCSAHASVPSVTGRLTAASRACRVWCARLVCR